MRDAPTSPPAPGPAGAVAAVVRAAAAAPDFACALRAGLRVILETLGADAAAISRGGEFVAAEGWGDGPPSGQLLAEAGHAVRIRAGKLLLARPGAALTAAESELLEAMADALGVTAGLAGDLATERVGRTRADDLARELTRRRRLFEDLSAIQRSISHRAPLPEVLDAIVGAAEELFGDEMPALLLADEDDPSVLTLAASRGLSPEYRDSLGHRRAGEGVAGRAYAEGRLVVVEDYGTWDDGMPRFQTIGVTAAMAAPVHEHGRPIGSLIVSTNRPGRRYSAAERDILASLASHASLAVSDAKTVAAMEHQAMHDALTGLPNGALFRDRLEHAVARAARTESPIGVLFCDLDRFKAVNDSLGHAGGDELLVEIGSRLRQAVRASDTAARLGGDEFAVLLEDLGHSEPPHAVARRIVEAVGRPLTVRGHEIRPRVSVGVAAGTADAHDLLRSADLAMYRVKGEGRGGVAVFESAMREEAVDRVALEADLARAVERDQLEVDYQPIVALDGAAIVGFEALVRWSHAERGRVPPGDFIPLAEESGLVRDIGRHVLHVACDQAAGWRAAHPGASLDTITVNLSGRELSDPELPADVAAALERSGLPPACLVLEITETVLMRDTEATIARLQELKALGVRLAVDDFGTGYSSLRYLHRFPVDILKLAKPFVDAMVGDDDETALVCAILDLGSNLRLDVIAEGIELEEQAVMLSALGCDMAQGYHYARPLGAAAATAALADAAAGGPAGARWRLRA
jgi:diguanylate cyclase (GGDEF)-like protein